MINFEVEVGECITNNEKWDSRYIVLIWCSWFSHLANISEDLAKIEKQLDNL